MSPEDHADFSVNTWKSPANPSTLLLRLARLRGALLVEGEVGAVGTTGHAQRNS
jgi:hypothetical protein